ncbi:MAG TPA: hypothetical protein VMS43_15075 [Allosphingosinicella sp.]|nr:hypothetical protein [Allosphingosinicella sp.]
MIKPSVLCVEVDEGTYIESGSNNFLIRNRKLFPVIDRILANLDGRAAPEEVRAALPAKVHPLFDRLLDNLEEFRMLTTGPGGAALDAHPFREVFLYLQEASSDAQACYADWSRLPITVAGSSAQILAILNHLLASGAANLTILTDDLGAEDATAAASLAAELATRASLVARGADPDALLICAYDERPAPPVLDGLRALAALHGRGIFGAVCGDLAVIGPETGGDLGAWPDLLALAPETPEPMVPLATSVLSALIAFEALQARLAPWSDDPEEAVRRRNSFRVLRNDCRVTSHDARVALASKRPLAATAPAPNHEPAPLDEASRPLFDDAVGPLRWVDGGGPDYPLAHRAISSNGRAVCHWGIDFASAEERCLALALGIFADDPRQEAGLSPTIAARGEERLRGLAAAYALAGSPRRIAPVCPKSLDDADLQVLIRLARLYWGESPRLWLSGTRGNGGCVGWARMSGTTCAVPAPGEQEALFEALGDLLSALQRGVPADRQMLLPCGDLAVLPLPEAEPSTLADYLSSCPEGEAAFEYFEDPDDPLRAFGYVVGRAKLLS